MVNGIQYVTTGGGGAELDSVSSDARRTYGESTFEHTVIDVDVPGKSLTMRMIRTSDGEVRDSVTLRKADAGPTAALVTTGPVDQIVPKSNTSLDQDPHAGELLLKDAPSSFVIQLTDPDDIDDNSVNSDVVRIVKDGATMSPTTDYSYSYSGHSTHQITLTRAGGLTFDRGVYEIRLSETQHVEDLASPTHHAMALTVIRVVVEPSWTETVLVDDGDSWRYQDDGSNQGTAWRAPSFNDTSWDSGPSELGYSPNNEDGAATVVGYIDTDPNTQGTQKNATTYFRHEFYVDKKSNHFDWLTLSLLRDDGAVVYLNGAEVPRHNMKTNEAVTYTSWARSTVSGTDESRWWGPFIIDPSLLVDVADGKSVLAVEIHQDRDDSSDISFNLKLKAYGSKVTNTFDSQEGLLEVYGTAYGDEIALSSEAVSGQQKVKINGTITSVLAADVDQIKVYGYGGDDTLSVTPLDQAFDGTIDLYPGAGDDTALFVGSSANPDLVLSTSSATLSWSTSRTAQADDFETIAATGSLGNLTSDSDADLTVPSGDTLTVNGQLSIIAPGVSPDFGIGSLDVTGNLTLADSAVYLCDVGATTDEVTVSGTVTIEQGATVTFKPHGGSGVFQSGQYTILSAQSLSGTFSSSTGLGSYVTSGGLSYTSTLARLATDHDLLGGDANLSTKTDVSDLNIWNQNKFQNDEPWSEGDFTGDGNNDVYDLNVWMKYKFQQAEGLLDGDNTIDVVYDPDTGILTVDTTGTHLRSLIVPGPEAESIDRWAEDEYQDNVFWTQQYFNAKEQWGGTGGTYVPEDEYQVATYATGLDSDDFGEVEFCTYEGDILSATVQILGEGLRAGGGESMAAAATDAALASMPAGQTAGAVAAWLYQYDPTAGAKRPGEASTLVPAAVDAWLAAYGA